MDSGRAHFCANKSAISCVTMGIAGRPDLLGLDLKKLSDNALDFRVGDFEYVVKRGGVAVAVLPGQFGNGDAAFTDGGQNVLAVPILCN